MPAKSVTTNNDRGHGPLLRENKPGHRALRRGRVSLPNQAYLVTATTLNRQPFFLDFRAGCVAASCFEDRAILANAAMLAWVLMPDHVHWLLQLGENDDLNVVINRLKSASSRLANRELARSGALWERGYHDHALRTEENLRGVARYLAANPLRVGLVQHLGDYPFWNAVWL
jgi:REP element-mobilizing transposase RayT